MAMHNELPRTRHSLLRRLHGERDDQAWSEFLSIYEPLLLRMMRRRGLQESDARDTTQQVLIRINGAIERYRPDGAEASFRRWLFRIARNVALTLLTSQTRQPKSLNEHQMAEPFDVTPGAGADAEQFDFEFRQQVLAWALQQIQQEFQPTTWSAFVETSVHGKPIADVARDLGISVGSVYVARSRIIARLRNKVEEFEAAQ